ncbi:MAG: 3-deoxy-manno-octulosonate cytidylyltransferase [Alphaproteobacteria bacterium]|nr:MAG: 3-deoxy-manno-octulosonate cytidylyltransferase [Alphaproteobacteria bacterium]
MSTLIVIPARLQATRLPNKPLADIGGKPMIIHIWERAIASQAGEVVVACCHERTADVIKQAGGQAVITDPDLPSGTDRVAAAAQAVGFNGDYILNVQGDMPFIEPENMRACLDILKITDVDISTVGCPISNDQQWLDISVVKALVSPLGPGVYEAHDFTRNDPADKRESAFYHLGLYAYRPEALQKFVSLSPSLREKERSLEQMRAQDNGMRIGFSVVQATPLSVDTQSDLLKARQLFATKEAW